MANPEIIEVSDEDATYEEGCCRCPSITPTWSALPMCACATSIAITSTKEIDCEGLLATCLQHEIDHLDGVLFIDHTVAQRNMILRKLLKAARTPSARRKKAKRGPESQIQGEKAAAEAI